MRLQTATKHLPLASGITLACERRCMTLCKPLNAVRIIREVTSNSQAAKHIPHTALRMCRRARSVICCEDVEAALHQSRGPYMKCSTTELSACARSARNFLPEGAHAAGPTHPRSERTNARAPLRNLDLAPAGFGRARLTNRRALLGSEPCESQTRRRRARPTRAFLVCRPARPSFR